MNPILVLFLGAAAGAPSPEPADLFPLEVGTTWVYQGEFTPLEPLEEEEEQEEDVDPPASSAQQVTRRMTVVRSHRFGRYAIALLHGHPADAWDTEPCWHLILSDGRDLYHLENFHEAPPMRLEYFTYLGLLAAHPDTLPALWRVPEFAAEMLPPEGHFLRYPPPETTCFEGSPLVAVHGADEEGGDTGAETHRLVSHLGAHGCWSGREEGTVRPAEVEGIPPGTPFPLLHVTAGGLSWAVDMELLRGVGIYRYRLRDDYATMDLRLVEFRRGPREVQWTD